MKYVDEYYILSQDEYEDLQNTENENDRSKEITHDIKEMKNSDLDEGERNSDILSPNSSDNHLKNVENSEISTQTDEDAVGQAINQQIGAQSTPDIGTDQLELGTTNEKQVVSGKNDSCMIKRPKTWISISKAVKTNYSAKFKVSKRKNGKRSSYSTKR